jgi:rubredoxin
MEEDKKMQPCVCGRCGYIYDPQKGDKKGKIPPGVPSKDLPEDWVCPLCGASKKIFSPMLGYDE